ncbi:MAG TPA: DUF6544 family protein [Acidimicrobiales bacterium]|nr:DUF6544 family protein [Acidimicrobiales bacterium]
MMATALDAALTQDPVDAVFSDDELVGLPEPVRRHLQLAIAPGTPLALAAHLRIRGHIKLGRWLPFRASQLLAPHRGTVWTARIAGLISGSDQYAAGSGGMDWKLAGLVRLVHADGPDVSRSSAERAAGEGIWLPTALLPRCIQSLVFDRWGDPSNKGEFGLHPFSGEVTEHRTFHGVTISSGGSVGWFYGTDRWNEGEFFRYRITDHHLVVASRR